MVEQSVILELQSLALDSKNNISDLLRKSLLVATKLQLTDFLSWVSSELNGYKQGAVPEYRKISAELKLKNPYRGLIPLVIEDPQMAKAFSEIDISEAIESLENLLRYSTSNDNTLQVPLPPQLHTFALEMQNSPYPLPVVRIIGRNHVAAIIDAVRTNILNWALKLEQAGILGNGISFSENERKIAVSASNIHINNFQGVLGEVKESNLTQNLNLNVVTNDFESLSKCLSNHDVSKDDIIELKHAIEKDPKPTSVGKFGEQVSSWFGKMIGKALSGNWAIDVGAATNFLTTALSQFYGS